jgi:hypothetical protein
MGQRKAIADGFYTCRECGLQLAPVFEDEMPRRNIAAILEGAATEYEGGLAPPPKATYAPASCAHSHAPAHAHVHAHASAYAHAPAYAHTHSHAHSAVHAPAAAARAAARRRTEALKAVMMRNLACSEHEVARADELLAMVPVASAQIAAATCGAAVVVIRQRPPIKRLPVEAIAAAFGMTSVKGAAAAAFILDKMPANMAASMRAAVVIEHPCDGMHLRVVQLDAVRSGRMDHPRLPGEVADKWVPALHMAKWLGEHVARSGVLSSASMADAARCVVAFAWASMYTRCGGAPSDEPEGLLDDVELTKEKYDALVARIMVSVTNAAMVQEIKAAWGRRAMKWAFA